MILDGYQTADDLPLSDGCEVVLIEKGVPPSQEQLEQMLSARLTPGVYQRLKGAAVGIAGLGGLGSRIALDLARSGVGRLNLIDFDTVEPSNLNRQQYRFCHLGLPKAEALKLQIGEINPFVRVTAQTTRITEENAVSLFEKDDVVCEAFDNPETKAMLINTLLEQNPNRKIVAASGMAGYESANTVTTRRVMGNFYLCGDGQTDSKPGRGLMAPRVAVCAGHQANMIIRLILGETET